MCGFPNIRGTFFGGGPYTEDYSILGSILELYRDNIRIHRDILMRAWQWRIAGKFIWKMKRKMELRKRLCNMLTGVPYSPQERKIPYSFWVRYILKDDVL